MNRLTLGCLALAAMTAGAWHPAAGALTFDEKTNTLEAPRGHSVTTAYIDGAGNLVWTPPTEAQRIHVTRAEPITETTAAKGGAMTMTLVDSQTAETVAKGRSAGLAAAATFSIVTSDGASEGLNDPTAVSAVGGNPGTTLGAQRYNSIVYAASLISDWIESDVTIIIHANFDSLTCTGTSAVLGSAGPATVTGNFTGAPLSNTWYTIAHANSLAGTDLATSSNDITVTYNSEIDNACLNGYSGWYYGYDSNPAAGQLDFTGVIIHELFHGLGFLTLIDSDGAKASGYDDIFMTFLYDLDANKAWTDMTDAERVTSILNDGGLVWNGTNVTANVGGLTAGTAGGYTLMYAPATYESGSSTSHFDKSLEPDELMEPITNDDPFKGLAVYALKDMGWVVTDANIPEVPVTLSGFQVE